MYKSVFNDNIKIEIFLVLLESLEYFWNLNIQKNLIKAPTFF